MGFIYIIIFILTILFLILGIVSLVKKKPAKKKFLLSAGCLVVFIVLTFTWAIQPAVDVEKTTIDKLQTDVLSEVKGDITSITPIETDDGKLYEILVDDKYLLYTNPDVSGVMPEDGSKNVTMYVTKDADGTIVVISFPKE